MSYELTDAFDKLSAHLRHNSYGGGCSICDAAIHEPAEAMAGTEDWYEADE